MINCDCRPLAFDVECKDGPLNGDPCGDGKDCANGGKADGAGGFQVID